MIFFICLCAFWVFWLHLHTTWVMTVGAAYAWLCLYTTFAYCACALYACTVHEHTQFDTDETCVWLASRRGAFGVETVLTLFAYKVAYPRYMHLNRGNHETVSMNKLYGFEVRDAHQLHIPFLITLQTKCDVCAICAICAICDDYIGMSKRCPLTTSPDRICSCH